MLSPIFKKILPIPHISFVESQFILQNKSVQDETIAESQAPALPLQICDPFIPIHNV